MAPSSLALKAQSDAFLAGMRGARQRNTGSHELLLRRPISDHLHLVEPLPHLIHAPTTRRITAKGRVQARIANATLQGLLGWEAGSLEVSQDGSWTVLRTPVHDRRARRFDGSCALEPTGRLRLSGAVLHRLGLEIGDEVALLALPEEGSLALINPALLLLAAPLSLVATPTSAMSTTPNPNNNRDGKEQQP